MRIAYVTAHYPPDFTSGATLLVDRLARQANELGHDVEVFSGAIGQGLADGELRTDTLDSGLVVHWIGTAQRIEQGDDGNWDNPLAAAAVTAWLEEFRPDVVHMHTLQTLGVGVVEAAADSGIPTVVTMHDLWWWCSRLFLVDTSLQPCPLVTDVGTCACARTPTWRAHRAARLRTALDRVDRILAPSSTLRDVIVANGVHPDRVAVDENDVATVVRFIDEPDVPNEPVRFLYLGGDSPLKGADVIRSAVELLADAPGWTLDAYGLSAAAPLPAEVRAAPAFEPDELMSVLGETDVLVIPSIARESFSIAAREALVAGLSVITSDCLGPEEVVLDGVNGIVTPTGDAVALAGAMRMLIDDRSALDRLRANARHQPVAIRSTTEHVNSLIDRYGSPSPPGEPRSWNVAFVVGADGAIARYRVHHAREALELHGGSCRVAHYLDPALDRIADGMDVVVLQRVPATASLLGLIEQWRRAGVLVVFDVDDLIFDPDLIDEIPGLGVLTSDEQALYLDGLHRYRTTLGACDGAIVSTAAIADHVRDTTGLPAEVVANGLGLVELRLAVDARSRRRRDPADRRLRLAYFSGSDSHQPNIDMVNGALAEVMERHRNVDLLVVGPVSPGPLLGAFPDRVEQRDLLPWRQLFDVIAGADVNLAPLVLPSRFNESKSAVKWLEAAAVGVPTVASASTPFGDAIDHGRTGMLCRTLDDWQDSISILIDSSEQRGRMGAAAQRRVELHHGPHLTAHRYAAALTSLQTRALESRAPRPNWSPVAPDERAPSAPLLGTYDVGAGAGVEAGRRRSWGHRIRRR